MSDKFNFLMIGAMYENGGNTTHRFLDGHPELYVYPYESQLGTKFVNDMLSSTFPLKYRWPTFPIDANAYQDYKFIIDEECKVRSRTPQVSKFRHMEFDFSDDERCDIYQEIIGKIGRSRPNNIRAFFEATFRAWKNFNRSGKESVYVGYSPIVTVDAPKILNDLPGSNVLHIVRNPWSAYADTKKRPMPMSLPNYMLGWTLNQYYALLYQKQFPGRVHVIRIEDVMADPEKCLGELCRKIGISSSPTLGNVSWNGTTLEEVFPWGTIRNPSPESNKQTALELSGEEIDLIGQYTAQYLDVLEYKGFV